MITRDGQPVDTLYLILDGVLSVSEQDGRSLRLGRIGKGKWIGEVSLFSGTPFASSIVTAEGPVRLLALRHADFESLRKDHVEAAGRLTHLLVEILIAPARHVRPAGQTADGRLMLPGANVQQLPENPIAAGSDRPASSSASSGRPDAAQELIRTCRVRSFPGGWRPGAGDACRGIPKATCSFTRTRKRAVR